MNRDKIVDIATKLPREAYIDLLCAGAETLYDYRDFEGLLMKFRNMSLNQVDSLIVAYKEQGKEEVYERP